MFTRRFISACIISVFALYSIAGADLVSRWEFSGNANDSIGDNDGTLTNGAYIGADPVHGQVLALDGINDYVDCGNDSSLDVGGGSFTVAAWVKRPTINGVFPIITKGFPSSPYTGWEFEIYTWYTNEWRMKVWTPQEHEAEVFFPFAADTWYHVAAVRDADNSQISYYVNGQLELTLSFSNADNSNSSNLTIGSLSGTTEQYFRGMMDDVRIYDNALTAGEIASIVPEPATICLFGLAGLMLRNKRK